MIKCEIALKMVEINMNADENHRIKKLKELRKSLYENTDNFHKIVNLTINKDDGDSVDAYAQNKLAISVVEKKALE